jgi:hypothetical protein
MRIFYFTYLIHKMFPLRIKWALNITRISRVIWFPSKLRGAALKFLEWFCCSHTYIFTAYWEGSPSMYSHLAAMHLAQRCYLPLLETGFELLVWNNFLCPRHCFYVFINLKSSSLWDTIYFWKQPEVTGEDGVCSNSVIDFWARNCLTETTPCELEHCHGGISNRCAEVLSSVYVQLHITTSIFPHNELSWNFGLVEWIQSEQYLNIEESDEHCLHLWFRQVNFVESWRCRLFPLQSSVICFLDHTESTVLHLLPNFTKEN